ncbi:outer membrane protein TOM13-domain-containing protein [Aspergillus ambiguus]|uniref:TOM13-domain-containing protein n=1 Tax=Aspergillus ambiguus TaxID=176160 RepID=UPI003CCE23B7
MSDNHNSPPELYESGLTVPSDSENYSANNELSSSTSSSPLILYKPPTFWSILRGAAINLFLPFVNGLMLGFGELFAHEAAYRLGWSGTKVFPLHRRSRPVGPGVEVRELPSERRRNGTLRDTASLE